MPQRRPLSGVQRHPVGPQATATLIASTKVSDLTPMTGRFEDVHSVKVACAKQDR